MKRCNARKTDDEGYVYYGDAKHVCKRHHGHKGPHLCGVSPSSCRYEWAAVASDSRKTLGVNRADAAKGKA